jgi:hypothetical protein
MLPMGNDSFIFYPSYFEALPACGGALNSRLACKDHGWFEFNAGRLEYQFQESGGPEFSRMIRERFKNKTRGHETAAPP